MVEIMPSDGAGQFAYWKREMERRLGALETARSGDYADWQTHVETFDVHDASPTITSTHNPIITVTITPPTWATTALVISTAILVTQVASGMETMTISISDDPWVTTGPDSQVTNDATITTLVNTRSFIVASAGAPFDISLDASASATGSVASERATFAGAVIHRR